MTVRPLQESDLPALKAMAESSGFPYPEMSSARLESAFVVIDDDGTPVMACAAERLVQLYLFCGDIERPHAKVFALRLLHEAMAPDLKAKGYGGVEAFLPPAIAGKFARRLEKTFGWVRNWPSWTRRI